MKGTLLHLDQIQCNACKERHDNVLIDSCCHQYVMEPCSPLGTSVCVKTVSSTVGCDETFPRDDLPALQSPHGQASAQHLCYTQAKVEPGTVAAGPAAAQFFDLLQELVADSAAAMHLVAHDILTIIVAQVKLHVMVLVQAEYGCSLKLLEASMPSQGTEGLSSSTANFR